jgi:flagellar hook protein FlgE
VQVYPLAALAREPIFEVKRRNTMPSFDIPLSGLNADSTALNTIANNLSNMNTTGFKSQTTNFSDLFYQQVGTTGSGDQIQVGTGVQVSSNSTDFTGGSISSTGVSTDAAIDGSGFFVLDAGNGEQLYTRDGNFQTSATGTLESTDGKAVMGYMATNGVISTTGSLSDITIPTSGVMQPSSTTSFSLTQNLDSADPVGATTSGSVKVFDSLGKSYEATVTYTNLGDNKWSYAITLPDTLTAGAATAAAATTMTVAASEPTATAVPTNATVVAPAVTTVPSILTAGNATSTSTNTALAASPNLVNSTNTTTAVTDAQTTPVAGTTMDSYAFAATGLVAAGTTLTINGPGGGPVTVTPTTLVNGVESVTQFETDISNAIGGANFTGNAVSVTQNGQTISISGPSASYSTSAVTIQQDIPETTTNYNFVTSNGATATVDPTTTLGITEGAIGPITAPAFTSSESVSTYANNLQQALTTAGILDVKVSGVNGVLSITKPSNATIVPGAKGVIQDFSGTSTNYSFGTYTDPTSGLSVMSTVDPTTTLQITGPTTGGATTTVPANGTSLTFSKSPETVADYASDLQQALTTAGITGVTVTGSNITGNLSIVGPTGLQITGNLNQDMKGTTNNYTFETNATVAPTTNLKISGETANGSTATITAPTVTSGETIAQYAAALSSALTTAGIENVSVTPSVGQLSIVGANMTVSGNVVQNLSDSTVTYNFGSTATVDPSTAITIVGPTVSGNPATAITTAPTVTKGETVAQYAAALENALANAPGGGIITGTSGVTVTANGGLLSIVGPAATLKVAGTASQDLSASTINYDFGASNGTVATVDSSTNLTITGLTATGASATITAPTVTAGETLTQYVTDLSTALSTAGIAGVSVSSTPAGVLSITGANVSTSGNVVQDPVGSANSSGTLTFDANGNLVSPSSNLSNITFNGLSDNASTMNMSWNLFGTTGTGNISQTDALDAQSGQTQNGYTSGDYTSFTIGSDGTITAKYSNGQNQTVGQIGLATVSNMQGLADVGSTEYQTTTASGQATVGVAGTGSRGTLEGSSLEASNVNISAEFSDLIVAQRAFEANAKSVTTFDTITQETINMIH